MTKLLSTAHAKTKNPLKGFIYGAFGKLEYILHVTLPHKGAKQEQNCTVTYHFMGLGLIKTIE